MVSRRQYLRRSCILMKLPGLIFLRTSWQELTLLVTSFNYSRQKTFQCFKDVIHTLVHLRLCAVKYSELLSSFTACLVFTRNFIIVCSPQRSHQNHIFCPFQVLCDFRSLKFLYLHGNAITDVLEAEKLGGLPRLIKLTLHGNPMENTKVIF